MGTFERQKIPFVELHAHSEYSNFRFLDSTNKLEELIRYVYNKGFRGLAITDHESLSGHIKAIQIAKQIKEEDKNTDFKVILGNEIYLVDEIKPQDKYYHFLLLAKNKTGHRQIRELSTYAWEHCITHHRQQRPMTTYEVIEKIIEEYGQNLIASTACLGGFLAQHIKQLLTYKQENNTKMQEETKDKINKFIQWNINTFGKDNFFIELQPALTQEQIEVNKMSVRIAKAWNIKWIITNDTHYFNKQWETVHSAFLKSRDEDRETDDFYENCYFKDVEEMRVRMEYMGVEDFNKGIANTWFISDQIEFYDLYHEVVIPQVVKTKPNIQHIFIDFYSDNEYLKKFAYSEHQADQLLLTQIEEGFIEKSKRFGEKWFAQYSKEMRIARINTELRELWLISEKLGQRMSGYYTLTEKVVDIMWHTSEAVVGVARGSVTGFFICYLIDITQADPIEYNLPHWRHLTSERPELPKRYWALNVNRTNGCAI